MKRIFNFFRRKRLMREAKNGGFKTRILYKIDVSSNSINAKQALEFSEMLRSRPSANPVTGEFDFKYTPVSIEKDFFI